MLRINDDKLTLQKQVVELTEKKQERFEILIQSLIDSGQLKAEPLRS